MEVTDGEGGGEDKGREKVQEGDPEDERTNGLTHARQKGPLDRFPFATRKKYKINFKNIYLFKCYLLIYVLGRTCRWNGRWEPRWPFPRE
jgi:hypothetical protein